MSNNTQASSILPGCERAQYETSCFTEVAPACGRKGFAYAETRTGDEFVVCKDCAHDCIGEDVKVLAAPCTVCDELVPHGESSDGDEFICESCFDARPS